MSDSLKQNDQRNRDADNSPATLITEDGGSGSRHCSSSFATRADILDRVDEFELQFGRTPVRIFVTPEWEIEAGRIGCGVADRGELLFGMQIVWDAADMKLE